MLKLKAGSVDDHLAIATQIINAYPGSRVFALYGVMGAGKTTLIKAFCKVLGVGEVVVSPTFSLINEYRAENGLAVYHFDFYRIRSLTEAYDMGYEEYFYSGNYCFIEWPEKIEELLPTGFVYINIGFKNHSHTRIIEVRP